MRMRELFLCQMIKTTCSEILGFESVYITEQPFSPPVVAEGVFREKKKRQHYARKLRVVKGSSNSEILARRDTGAIRSIDVAGTKGVFF